jgi:hypothetical protein
MSKRLDKAESMRKLRGIYSDALRAASCSGEFIAFGQSNTSFSVIGNRSGPLKRRSGYRYCPAIAQALGLLSSSALSSCATVRLSARCGGSQPGSLLIYFKLRRDLYRRGVKLLTINKERT